MNPIGSRSGEYGRCPIVTKPKRSISNWVDATVWVRFISVQNKGLKENALYLFLQCTDLISLGQEMVWFLIDCILCK